LFSCWWYCWWQNKSCFEWKMHLNHPRKIKLLRCWPTTRCWWTIWTQNRICSCWLPKKITFSCWWSCWMPNKSCISLGWHISYSKEIEWKRFQVSWRRSPRTRNPQSHSRFPNKRKIRHHKTRIYPWMGWTNHQMCFKQVRNDLDLFIKSY